MSQLESRHISSFLSQSICPTLSSDPGSILTPSLSLCPSPLCASFSPIICLLLSPLPLPFHFFLTNHESPWISFSNWLVQLLKHIVCAHTHTRTTTCLSAHPWQTYWLLQQFPQQHEVVKYNVFCYGMISIILFWFNISIWLLVSHMF